MKLPRQRAAPAESPPQKLTTIFQFRNFRRNFTRQLDDIVGAVNEQVFSFRAVGLLLQGEHHQVTELVVKTPDLADDPDLKLHVEKARTRNGVTSFGAGPNFANNMLVFEVLHTYHTFDWSDLEMPMPIVGRCVLAVGEERQIFPGPKFPMSHQLYGFGSELEKGSTHYHALSGGSVEFEANFEQVPWIRQEPYSRIVLPGMYVPSFLSLSVIVAHRRILNMFLEEPLHLTNVRVEFQEFSCVPNKYLQSTEVRSKVLVDKKISMEIFRANWLLTVPDTFYDCVIPKVGPTFFTEGFIRTYGLKITVALSHKSGPSFNASAFVEINVAQEKYEKIHEKDIFNPRYMGTDGIETCYGKHSSLKPFQTSEPTDDSLSSFSRLNADEATGKFQRYCFLMHNNGEKGCFLLSADIMKGPKFADSRSEPKSDFLQSSSKLQKWLGSPTWLPSRKCLCSGLATRRITLPTFGAGSTRFIPLTAPCLVVNGQVIEANLPRAFTQLIRSYPYPSCPLGEEGIPLSIVVSLYGRTLYHRSREETFLCATPGMELDKFAVCKFIVARPFKDASRYQNVEDTSIHLEHIRITLLEERYENGKKFEESTPLLDGHFPCTIRWSEFQDAVIGSPEARTRSLPPGFLDCRIPIDTKPSLFCFKKGLARWHELDCSFVVSNLGRRYTLHCRHQLYITQETGTSLI